MIMCDVHHPACESRKQNGFLASCRNKRVAYRKLQNVVWQLFLALKLLTKLTQNDLFTISIYNNLNKGWLKTVSSTFKDVDFDGSLLPLFIS